MALAKKSTAKTTEKLAVAERLGQVFISSVRTKKNTNGTEFISTPHGAVYTAVKLSNGAIALNDPYNEEVMGFINDKIGEYPNLSAGDIREMYSL